jgi:hypothetical protein
MEDYHVFIGCCIFFFMYVVVFLVSVMGLKLL